MHSSEHHRGAALHTATGDLPLHEYELALGGREWTVLHTGAVLSFDDEQHYLKEQKSRLPYGVVLWPAAVALAHELASRPDDFRDRRVLELGAGTGLPGIVAAAMGARVVQTDRLALALDVARRNGERNRGHVGVAGSLRHRLADWTRWDDTTQYDWILGSDVLYAETMHPHLRRIFESNLAAGGRVLLSDPFRAPSLRLLEAMEAAGWSVSLSKWSVGEDDAPRAVGVFELTPPSKSG